MKDFDTFSFQAKNSEKDIENSSQKQIPHQPVRWDTLQYRFKPINVQKPKLYNDRVLNIEKDLQQNIRRRLQLEQKLQQINSGKKEIRVQQFFKQQNVQTQDEQIQNFVKMEQKAKRVQQIISPQKSNLFEKRKIQQTIKKQKQVKKAPSQIKIHSLFNRISFPQLPKQNLQKLMKQCQFLVQQYNHSDLHYLLMCIYFHMGIYQKVRKHYKEILTYKLFQKKAHWVAAETQFQSAHYDLCIKLADKCMNQLSDQNLPRYIYIQARSYQAIGNYINSIVCYNQLIKMKPKIPQYYLERGIIYAKIGYLKQAHQDILMFGMLKPQASDYVKEKILTEKDQNRKKQYLRILRNLS